MIRVRSFRGRHEHEQLSGVGVDEDVPYLRGGRRGVLWQSVSQFQTCCNRLTFEWGWVGTTKTTALETNG